ncbi:vacuolar ATP synthase subunit S1-domain-containing protein [Mycena polygramma]|nr:vacuolar ATP synthase subunit S1-domain-containing protein [Mycena polygramma]
MSVRFLTVAALLPLALAFSDTSPVVSWSSHSSSTLNALPSKFSHSHSLLDAILSSEDVCGHDAIVFVDQPELHASDLRNLPSNTHLTRSLSASPSSRQFPYVSTHASVDISALLDSAAQRCGSRLVSFAPGQGVSLSEGSKHIVSLNFPPLAGMAQERKDAMLKHDALLASELATLAATFPNYLIIYTGSSSPSFAKRAAPMAVTSTRNGTSTGGILAHYQLLTPGIITTLLITFFILVPVIMVGIQSLVSIQSPLRNEIPKSFDAAEKKNQ